MRSISIMKWIFVLLLVANVAYFVFEFDNLLQESTLRGMAVEFNSPPGGEPLVLTNELDRPPELHPIQPLTVAENPKLGQPQLAKPKPAKPGAAKAAKPEAVKAAKPEAAKAAKPEAAKAAKPEAAKAAKPEAAKAAKPAQSKGPKTADPMAAVAECVSVTAAEKVTVPPLKKGCYTIGVFQSEKSAAAFGSKLTESGAAVRTRKGECKRPRERFVVYIPPQGSDALVEKKVAEIKGKGVKDHFVYRTGIRKNGISLGVFSKNDLAVAWQRQLIGKGITAMVVPDYHVKSAYWLDGNLSKDITESLPKGVSAAKIPCNRIKLD